MFIGAAGFGVSELLLAPVHSTAVAGALLFVCGVFFTSYTATSNTTIQLASPDYIRGRVLGLYYYAWNGLAPLGALLVGWMCDRGGTELTFGVGGVCALAMTAARRRRDQAAEPNGAASRAAAAGRRAHRRIGGPRGVGSRPFRAIRNRTQGVRANGASRV